MPHAVLGIARQQLGDTLWSVIRESLAQNRDGFGAGSAGRDRAHGFVVVGAHFAASTAVLA